MARIWCTNRFGMHPSSDPVRDIGVLGASQPPYASFNLGVKVGDDRERVLGNRERLIATTGLDEIRFMDQIHSALMVKVEPPREEVSCDGLFLLSDEWNRNIGIAVQVADCVPVIIEGDSVIAAIHIGRDGLMNGMTESALDALERVTSIEGMEAVIGPSICGDCYPNSQDLFARCTSRYPATGFDSAERKIDVAAGVISVLESKSVPWRWFGGTRECVSCDDQYFSYRRSTREGDGATGRQAMVVSW